MQDAHGPLRASPWCFARAPGAKSREGLIVQAQEWRRCRRARTPTVRVSQGVYVPSCNFPPFTVDGSSKQKGMACPRSSDHFKLRHTRPNAHQRRQPWRQLFTTRHLAWMPPSIHHAKQRTPTTQASCSYPYRNTLSQHRRLQRKCAHHWKLSAGGKASSHRQAL